MKHINDIINEDFKISGKTKYDLYVCPVCNAKLKDNNIIWGNEYDNTGQFQYYTCKCEKCNNKLVQVFDLIGFYTYNDFEKMSGVDMSNYK